MGLNVVCTSSYILGMRKVIKKMNFKDWDSKSKGLPLLFWKTIANSRVHSYVLQQPPHRARSAHLLPTRRGLVVRQLAQELPRRVPQRNAYRHDLLWFLRHLHLLLLGLVHSCHFLDHVLHGWRSEQAPPRRQRSYLSSMPLSPLEACQPSLSVSSAALSIPGPRSSSRSLPPAFSLPPNPR